MSACLYRRLAAECLRRAIEAADQERPTLRRMAIAWADMADQAERRNGAENEPSSDRPLKLTLSRAALPEPARAKNES
jgi:hypothetical protein